MYIYVYIYIYIHTHVCLDTIQNSLMMSRSTEVSQAPQQERTATTVTLR